jgi:hypothetical protein
MALVELNAAHMQPKLIAYIEEIRKSTFKNQQCENSSPFFIIPESDYEDQSYLLSGDSFLLDTVQTVIQQRLANVDLNS